ncbi:MAG: carboxypeptidase-like regulatory domain-containing protein, partial [Acidobacteriota bacterium]
TTDADGRYRIDGLISGDYRVAVEVGNFEPEYLNVEYPGVFCGASCHFDLGEPVTVRFEEETTGIDFTMRFSGSISGRVVDAATGRAAPNIAIRLSGPQVTPSVSTDANGLYRFPRVTVGTFEIAADRSETLLNPEVYTEDMGPGDQVLGLDFELLAGGVIEGRVKGLDGEPVEESVTLRSADGQTVRFGFSAAGIYRFEGVRAGTYFVEAGDGFEWIPQAWPGVNCPDRGGCPADAGEGIAVAEGGVVSSVDFTLDRFSIIRGRVTAAVTGEPLEGFVAVRTPAGEFVEGATVRDGDYRVQRVPPGVHVVEASGSANFLDAILGGGTCPAVGCDPSAGAPVEVGLNQELVFDFALAGGGTLSGTVFDADGAPLGGGINVLIYDGDGREVTRTSPSRGRWWVEALPPEDYRVVFTDRGGGYFDQVFGGGACVGPCDLSAGAVLSLSGGGIGGGIGGDIGGVDAVLSRATVISGRVRTADSGRPLPHVSVAAYSLDGRFLTSDRTEADGSYQLRVRQPARVATSSGGARQDQVWPGVPCPEDGCFDVLGQGAVFEAAPDGAFADVDFAFEAGEMCRNGGALCPLDERFEVTARWDTGSAQGVARAVNLTRESGYFWFFDAANVEVVVKVLDACDGFNHFWVFAAGLTNVEVELTVRDLWTGAVRTYRNPAGQLFRPTFDTAAFATCSAPPPPSPAGAVAGEGPPDRAQVAKVDAEEEQTCFPDSLRGCLAGGRFRLEALFGVDGEVDSARVVQLTDDTSYLWFFDEDNIEVVVKVLDACDGFDRYWVFAAGLTNVDVALTVTDTVTGALWTYRNFSGDDFVPVADTETLRCDD